MAHLSPGRITRRYLRRPQRDQMAALNEGGTRLPRADHILGLAAEATQIIGPNAETKIDGITLKADLIPLCASPVSHFFG